MDMFACECEYESLEAELEAVNEGIRDYISVVGLEAEENRWIRRMVQKLKNRKHVFLEMAL